MLDTLHDDKKVVIALAALFLDGEETGKGKNYKTLKGSYWVGSWFQPQKDKDCYDSLLKEILAVKFCRPCFKFSWLFTFIKYVWTLVK